MLFFSRVQMGKNGKNLVLIMTAVHLPIRNRLFYLF